MANAINKNTDDLVCHCDNKKKSPKLPEVDYNTKVETWLKNNKFNKPEKKKLKNKSLQYITCPNDNCDYKKTDLGVQLLTLIESKLQNLEDRIQETNERILKSEINNLRAQKKQLAKKAKCYKEKRANDKKNPTIECPATVQAGTMVSHTNVSFRCLNKQCDRIINNQCTCHGEGDDHSLICTMSCEITKLRKDVLDLKVMVANCLKLLDIDTNRGMVLNRGDCAVIDTSGSGSASSNSPNVDDYRRTQKRKKGYCGKKKKAKDGSESKTPPSPPTEKKKKRCYLSRLCKYCCIKF